MTDRSQLSATEVAFVQAARVAHLATADAAGNPHVVPVCYAFDGRNFLIALDEKPKRVDDRALRRMRNIEARSEVALLVDRYSDTWSELAYVLIHGHAVVLEPDDPNHAPALALLRERYPQYREMALEDRAVISITTRRVVSWGSVGT